MELRIPRWMPSDRSDEPPDERNGRVIPVMGAIPIFIAMLIKDWKARREREDRQKTEAVGFI